MHYTLESFFVGLYTCFIYFLVSCLSISNKYVIFLGVGFLKHFLGDYLELHTYYCNHGDACENKDENKITKTTTIRLISESLLEGCLFLLFGSLLYSISFLRNHLFILFFILGFSLHIIFELLGIHKSFCKDHCHTL